MSRRHQLAAKLEGFREVRSILSAMKNIALMELRALAGMLESQRRAMATIERAAADFLAFYPLPAGPAPVATVSIVIGSERGFCGEFNEARMRMTRIPAGAELVHNKVSAAPGFWLGNVIVMAGVPSIMQAMLDEVAPKLTTGVRMLSETVRADCREGDIGTQLGDIAKAHPDVAIGSYPFFDEQRGPNTNVVIRSRD